MRVWSWPGQFASASDVFETGGFQANASKTLSAAHVLKKIFRDIALPANSVRIGLEGPIRSFLLACDVLEILGNTQRGSTPSQLHNATRAWMEAHIACYGNITWVFKHHQAGHLAKMWDHFGILPNCWAMERKHKESKRVCTDHLNTRAYEQSIMEEITLDCIHHWQNFKGTGLIKPKEATKNDLSALAASFASRDGPLLMSNAYINMHGDKFCKLDVVTLAASHGACVGEVWFHCSRGGEELTCVSLWEQVSLRMDKHVAQFRISDAPKLIPSRDLVRPVIFKVHASIATILLPQF